MGEKMLQNHPLTNLFSELHLEPLSEEYETPTVINNLPVKWYFSVIRDNEANENINVIIYLQTFFQNYT